MSLGDYPREKSGGLSGKISLGDYSREKSGGLSGKMSLGDYPRKSPENCLGKCHWGIIRGKSLGIVWENVIGGIIRGKGREMSLITCGNVKGTARGNFLGMIREYVRRIINKNVHAGVEVYVQRL